MNDYIAAVAAPLRGPRRVRADMLAEIEDGFEEAVAEHVAAGLDRERAQAAAAAEFGAPGIVAAEVQRELAAAQARRTAWTLLVTLPAMTIMWDLFSGDGDPGVAVTLLARIVDAATAVAFGAAALVLTGHLQRRAASVCGLLGLVQIAVALGCSALIAVVAQGEGDAGTWAVLAAASGVGSALVCASSVRALAVARAAAA
ncbi:permease prefix domain 1-containing protein [Glycomyces terrestris]|uniref:Uncharacterized protein n=1 Tax=Glycomyces terrestris TaxID=2493553 RepID=A0A426UZV9_9ACTN|nr:permease prefix domain 1-containing protein [Glycomyces terrestris]RRS00171.1 hypothetical protein EIW28_06135 [Glycomyces terrestris]